jgi:hypothetical protein
VGTGRVHHVHRFHLRLFIFNPPKADFRARHTKLEPPSKKPLWTEEIQDLNTEQMRLVRDFLHEVKNQNNVEKPEND